MTSKQMTSYQVAVAGEAFAAALFAQAGFNVSVQYGANQPGYDLVVERSGRARLVSVKGSQDGSWGLTQSYLKQANETSSTARANYIGAIDLWEARHDPALIYCFVQFKDKMLGEMPEVFVATSREVAAHLRASGGNLGDTILHRNKTWKSGQRAGHTDRIPESWRFTSDRLQELEHQHSLPPLTQSPS